MHRINKLKIVIVETDKTHRDCLKSIISGWNCRPFCFEKETVCLDNVLQIETDLVIAGSLSGERAFRFIHALKMIDSTISVLMISDDHGIQNFIHTNGFFDVAVVNTTFEPSEIGEAIGGLLDIRSTNKRYQDVPLMIGNSPEIVKIKKMAQELSGSKEPVLIIGEPGTGKELLAKYIHLMSDRKNSPFVKVDCLSMPGDLFENELFGGQTSRDFKGAQKDRPGKLAAAVTGTVFIDEIGAFPVSLQPRLLQIIEEGYPVKPDSGKERPFDVRMIASTSADLETLVENGGFRKDIYYRINTVRIVIPSLRDRIDDISLLTDFFTDRFCREFGRSHYELSAKTKEIFSCYDWPGNITELESMIKTFVILDTEDGVADKINKYNKTDKTQKLMEIPEDIYALSELSDLKYYMEDMENVSLREICQVFLSRAEKKVMQKALERSHWNRKKAAKMLGISYKSLLSKIKAYALN